MSHEFMAYIDPDIRHPVAYLRESAKEGRSPGSVYDALNCHDFNAGCSGTGEVAVFDLLGAEYSSETRPGPMKFLNEAAAAAVLHNKDRLWIRFA